MITQGELIEIFSYDPSEGVFRHRRTSRRAIAGTEPGELDHNGYRRISIRGKKYRAHHLAWLYVHGELPATSHPGHQIDHINGHKADNRIANLRWVSASQNQQNMRVAQSNNTTGLLGVSRSGNKFRASIMDRGNLTIIGYFNTAEEAHQSYVAAKRKLHTFNTI